jgi:hypothetical protein
VSTVGRSDRDDIDLARAALVAAQGVPGVAGISRGRYAIARTFGLGGISVEGVQLAYEPEGLQVEVHLVSSLVPLLPLADAVRVAVADALTDLGVSVTAVHVWIEAVCTADDARKETTE